MIRVKVIAIIKIKVNVNININAKANTRDIVKVKNNIKLMIKVTYMVKANNKGK